MGGPLLNDENIAPEEKLDVLERLLLTDKSAACDFFAKNAQREHIELFRELLKYPYTVRRTNEYIIIIAEGGTEKYVSIIGLDDNYNLFCHTLPIISEQDIKLLYESPTDGLVRRLMGFDKHIWEVLGEDIYSGLTVRMQGDIVVRFNRVFHDEEELYAGLFGVIFNKVLSHYFPSIVGLNIFETLTTIVSNIVLDSIRSGTMDVIPKRIRSLEALYNQHIQSMEDRMRSRDTTMAHRIISTTLGDFFERVAELTEDILSVLPHYERVIRGRLARHEVKVIGVTEGLLHRAINDFNNELSPAHFVRGRIYVIRPSTITFFHPEHKSITLDIPRCILDIDVLRSIGAAIGIPLLRVKVVLLGPDRKSLFIRNIGRGFHISYRSVTGADFFVYAARRLLFPFGVVSLEFLIWDIASYAMDLPSVSLYCRGSRAAIVFFDVTDKESFLQLPHLISIFWRNSGAAWPVAIVGDISNVGERKREIPIETAREYARRLSETIGCEIPYIELHINEANRLTEVFHALARIIMNYYRRRFLRRIRGNF